MAHLLLLVGLAGALDLDVEMAREQAAQRWAQAFSALAMSPLSMAWPTSPNWAPDSTIRPFACGTSGSSVETAGRQRFQPLDADLGAALVLVGQPGLRQQIAQLQVAGAVLRQQQQAERLVAVVVVGDPGVDPDDRLDALAARRLVEADHGEGVGQVGHGQGRLLVLGRRPRPGRRCAPGRRRSSIRSGRAGG
jgi:hypothetical protein